MERVNDTCKEETLGTDARKDLIAPGEDGLRSILEKYAGAATIVHEIAPCDENTINALAVTPDGKYLLTAGDAASLWDIASGRCMWTFSANHGQLRCAATIPDGSGIVVAGMDRTFWLLDIETGRCRRFFAVQGDYISAAAVTPDSKRCIVGLDGGALMLDLDTGEHLHFFHTPLRVLHVAIAPDGGKMATVGQAGIVKVWEIATGRCAWTIGGYGSEVWAVAPALNGSRLVVGGRDGAARLLNVSDGRAEGILFQDETSIENLMIAPDGKRAISRGVNGVSVWDLDTGRCLHRIEQASSFTPTPDGQSLIVSKRPYSGVESYDLSTGARLGSYGFRSRGVSGIRVTPDGRRLLTIDFFSRLWDMNTGECVQGFSLHNLDTVTLVPDGLHMITSCWDAAELWSLNDGRRLLSLTHNENTVGGNPVTHDIRSIAVSPDGKQLITAGGGDIRQWDLSTGSYVRTFQYFYDGTSFVAVAPDGRRMTSVSPAGSVRLWDLATGRCLDELAELGSNVVSVAFTRDAGRCAAFYWNDYARMWDLPSGRPVQTLQMEGGIRSRAFSHDERLLVTAGNSGDSALWDVTTGERLQSFSGNRKNTLAACITPDGKRVITADRGHPVIIWDAESGQKLADLYNVERGFLWATPPDESAPSGWIWTNREDLVHVIKSCGEAASDWGFLTEGDSERRDYLRVHNHRSMVMTRVRDPHAYTGLAAAHRAAVERRIAPSHRRPVPMLSEPPPRE